MKLDSKVEAALEKLIESIQDSDSYTKYETYRKEAKSDFTLRSNINRTRAIREQLGRMSEGDKYGDAADNLIDEYDRLMDITTIHHFSLAEHEFCEMYQQIMSRLAENFNLDV